MVSVAFGSLSGCAGGVPAKRPGSITSVAPLATLDSVTEQAIELAETGLTITGVPATSPGAKETTPTTIALTPPNFVGVAFTDGVESFSFGSITVADGVLKSIVGTSGTAKFLGVTAVESANVSVGRVSFASGQQHTSLPFSVGGWVGYPPPGYDGLVESRTFDIAAELSDPGTAQVIVELLVPSSGCSAVRKFDTKWLNSSGEDQTETFDFGVVLCVDDAAWKCSKSYDQDAAVMLARLLGGGDGSCAATGG